ARLALRVLALPAVETKLTLNGSSQIARRLSHLAQKGLGAWNWKHTVAGISLVGMLFLMTAGCDFSKTSSSGSTGAKPTSSSQLLQKFETDLKAKNKDAILALYNSEGVSDWMKAGLADEVDDWLTRDVKGVNLSPLPAGFSPTGQHGEVRFHLNVKPMGVIEAHFTDGFGIGMPYGKKGGVIYIAGVVTEQIPVPENATNKSVTIYVRSADGKPVPHIVVGSGAPNAIPILHFKALYGGADQFFTDGQGGLSLPQAATNLFLVVANSRGFGWLPNGNLTNGAILVIQPWTQIEGTWKNRTQPVAGEKLSLSIPPALYAVRPVRFGGVETRTDVNGHFVFTNVPPLKMEIQRFGKQGTGAEIFGSAIASIELKGGGTKDLEIDTHGRTVLGKVIIGKGLDTNIDLADCSGQFEPANRNLDHLYFHASSNGCFEEDFVEPGDYTVAGSIDSDGKHVALLDSISVHVPDDPSDAADAPFDMGAVTLNAPVNLKSGDTAPDFATTTVEGQPLKLSDFRGKYVLLDFWATWCGPCVGETPNLKATYDAFGNDKRFAMVSLSLDAEREAPQQFARNHDIAWIQGFLGDWSLDKLTSKYGVYGIPSIFLIGPDGKILATDLRGPKIKEAVAAALGR
ncbi:MAG: TlpA family protein disulfide reductase, partial [Limisphaerales bacterium]